MPTLRNSLYLLFMAKDQLQRSTPAHNRNAKSYLYYAIKSMMDSFRRRRKTEILLVWNSATCKQRLCLKVHRLLLVIEDLV